MLSAMRYKNYTWPHNPRTFHMLWRRRVHVLDAPGSRYYVQELGRTCRVFRGAGEFCGPDAYAQFEQLERVFRRDGPGELIHPVWQSYSVYFTRLELTQEPRQDYVAYAFEFTETQGYNTGAACKSAPEAYTVRVGDTLWSIALHCGTDVAGLLEKNPQIANPNDLYVGQEVTVG